MTLPRCSPATLRRRTVGALLTIAVAACSRGDVTKAPTIEAPRGAMTMSTAAHPAWSKNAVIYEVNIRQYTPQGTFAAFSSELPRLRALGIDVLWLMPVQPIGKLNRKGTLGSYYSISDYTAINPEFGTESDFRALVDSAHALGFKVILDWVANHTAFDHAWTVAHKDWYTLRADGSISRAIDDKGKETDWSDVADLNYNSTAMRAAMITEMRWWLDTMHLDGFRCDMAGLVPTDFWSEVRTALDPGRPDMFFLAEWENPALHASFDATYAWELFHLMNAVAKGKTPPGALDAYFAKKDTTFDRSAYRLTFTSNHDENSWAGTEFERMGENHRAAYILSAFSQQAIPLLYSGQEASFNRRLKFFEKDQIDWSGASLAEFYRRTFSLRHTNDVLWSGAFGAPQVKLATAGGDRVYAFTRSRGDRAVVVLTNFGEASARVSYQGLPVAGSYIDGFTDAGVSLAAQGTIDVPAHGFRVLVK